MLISEDHSSCTIHEIYTKVYAAIKPIIGPMCFRGEYPLNNLIENEDLSAFVASYFIWPILQDANKAYVISSSGSLLAVSTYVLESPLTHFLPTNGFLDLRSGTLQPTNDPKDRIGGATKELLLGKFRGCHVAVNISRAVVLDDAESIEHHDVVDVADDAYPYLVSNRPLIPGSIAEQNHLANLDSYESLLGRDIVEGRLSKEHFQASLSHLNLNERRRAVRAAERQLANDLVLLFDEGNLGTKPQAQVLYGSHLSVRGFMRSWAMASEQRPGMSVGGNKTNLEQ